MAGLVKRELRPPAVVSAWRSACRIAARIPRFEEGQIQMDAYLLRYSDLLTLCPQWEDIFINRSLDFDTRSPHPRILDCGANVGLASLFFKSRYPRARITAFEADPRLAALLRQNLDVNDARDVETVAAAVWTSAGTVRFAADGADSGAIVGTDRDPSTIDVSSVRLRDYLYAETIDLLKLDVEGAELVVLSDCVDVLGNVKALLVEIHEFDSRRKMPQVLELLASCGFEYAVTHVTPIDSRTPLGRPFPSRSERWIAAVAAWRADNV